MFCDLPCCFDRRQLQDLLRKSCLSPKNDPLSMGAQELQRTCVAYSICKCPLRSIRALGYDEIFGTVIERLERGCATCFGVLLPRTAKLMAFCRSRVGSRELPIKSIRCKQTQDADGTQGRPHSSRTRLIATSSKSCSDLQIISLPPLWACI